MVSQRLDNQGNAEKNEKKSNVKKVNTMVRFPMAVVNGPLLFDTLILRL